MAVCKTKEHEYFVPDRRVAPLTDRQIKAIAAMSKQNPERGAKFVGALARSLDDETLRVLKAAEKEAPARMASRTRIGTPVEDIDRQIQADVNKLRQDLSRYSPETLATNEQIADRIAKNYRKTEVLPGAERNLLYTAYSKQLEELPLVMQQLDSALNAGDGNQTALFAAQLTKFITASTAIAGDKNAVSIAFKSFERLNKLIQSGKAEQVNNLFIDGTC